MMIEPVTFHDGCITLWHGDCLEALAAMSENSIESSVCDPPYHLQSIVKRFGADRAAPAKVGKTGAFARASSGFMGKQWDGGDIAFNKKVWEAVYRVLKPGAFVAAFGASRSYHRMACAIEDAGFEIRDSLMWLYGTGFPKSHDVSKGVDAHLFGLWLDTDPRRRKAYTTEMRATRAIADDKARSEATAAIENRWREWGGFARAVVGHDPVKAMQQTAKAGTNTLGDFADNSGDITTSATIEAAEWEGWGTALKPAFEPIVLARKPLSEGTVAANVLRWRTGALNINACLIETRERVEYGLANASRTKGIVYGDPSASADFDASKGRWPANVVTDGSGEVVAMFPTTGPSKPASRGLMGRYDPNQGAVRGHRDAGGSAARFFYSAKASKADRAGSKHPTVKPVALMRWLLRLVTPPGGITLDPFAGSGTTGEAALREGVNAVLIEREPEYQTDIARRMALYGASEATRKTESIKAKGKVETDPGPLFAAV